MGNRSDWRFRCAQAHGFDADVRCAARCVSPARIDVGPSVVVCKARLMRSSFSMSPYFSMATLIRGCSRRQVVLYKKSGDIMRAARVPTGTAIFEDTAYFWQARSVHEAAFLVGILNAPALRRAFAVARSRGRDFHRTSCQWVPIPRYGRHDTAHQLAARLAPRAEKVAARCVAASRHGGGQIAISGSIRDTLTSNGFFDRINDAVARVLPDHVDFQVQADCTVGW